jgi:light-regulated signal transduction histidine kinase (bacteriophytochrome)
MVSSFVQLLSDRYRGKLDADADDFIHFAVDGAQRMQEMIRTMLEYARMETAELGLVNVDANELVAEIVSLLESVIKESRAEITIEPLPELIADRTQLGQVFQNLISNALKFTAPGVTPHVRVSATREAESWQFCVEDNGIGIDHEHAGRIFAPFKRLHSRAEYPGAGLGLSVCKRAVDRLGGRIWIDPAPAGGSVFSFTIPDRSDEPDAAQR